MREARDRNDWIGYGKWENRVGVGRGSGEWSSGYGVIMKAGPRYAYLVDPA